MSEKSNTNVYWYLLLLLIITLFVTAMQVYTASQLTNPEINGSLSDEDIEYILQIQGINVNDFRNITTEQAQNNDILGLSNDTGSQSKDNAIEFFYSRSQGSNVIVIIKNVFSVPGYIAKLLNLPIGSISWIIGILNWFWRLTLILAGYYLVRGIK